jgi:hypothetical protein
MDPEPEMRAADKDRDSTISQIREAFAEGRLTNDERADLVRALKPLERLTAETPDG